MTKNENNNVEFEQKIPFGIIKFSTEGYIIFINDFARTIFLTKDIDYERITIKQAIPQLFYENKLKDELEIVNNNTKNYFKLTLNNYDECSAIFIQDITKEKELRRENDLLRTVLDHISEGVQISDSNDIMVLYNSTCEKIEKIDRNQYIGNKMYDLYKGTEVSISAPHGIVFKTRKAFIDQYNRYITAGGKIVDVITSTYPYFENGHVTAAYSIALDISKMKQIINKGLKLEKELLLSNYENGVKNGTKYSFDDIIGKSVKFNNAIKSAKKMSQGTSSILIYGETGTGKELFAQSIHNRSIFREGPFIAVNCAAIPDTLLESILFGTVKGAFTGAIDSIGLFEQAANGTLFLDEINSMNINLQSKLLRVLQEKTVVRLGDKIEREIFCRIISSVNEEPSSAISNNKLREDLYYRLAAITLYIPPLRERIEDIPVLLSCFIKKYNRLFGTNVKEISNELKHIFLNYSWPGNVREFEHVVESAINMIEIDEEVLEVDHLPEYIHERLLKNTSIEKKEISSIKTLEERIAEVERKIILESLRKNSYNITKTAKELGIFRQALQYRIKKHNIWGVVNNIDI